MQREIVWEMEMGRACVKNTFVANGRLAGLCTPLLRRMPVVMAATSHLFPWEQRSKSSLAESCRCLTLPPGKKKRESKTDWGKEERQGGNAEESQLSPSRSVSDLKKARPVFMPPALLMHFGFALFSCATNEASVITQPSEPNAIRRHKSELLYPY